jgi:hypothetical protein
MDLLDPAHGPGRWLNGDEPRFFFANDEDCVALAELADRGKAECVPGANFDPVDINGAGLAGRIGPGYTREGEPDGEKCER